MKKSLAFILVLLGLCAGSSAVAELKIEIVQYLPQNDNHPLVVVNAGPAKGMRQGTLLTSYRLHQVESGGKVSSIKVDTGQLKVVEVQEKLAFAKVIRGGSAASKAVFPSFPGVMVGDQVELQRSALKKKFALLPKIELTYRSIFQDPEANPSSFALTQEGRQQLEKAARIYSSRRIKLLMIEGHTDQLGSRSANQVESYQRALAVRRHILDVLQLDSSRVKAIGFGETQLKDQSKTAGEAVSNRRIVLKAIPL